jgi:hypothetical protein
MIRKSILATLTFLALASLVVDLIGRLKPFAAVPYNSDDAFVMVLFADGQIEVRRLTLGDLSVLDPATSAATIGLFPLLRNNLRRALHPKGRCFWRTSYSATIGIASTQYVRPSLAETRLLPPPPNSGKQNSVVPLTEAGVPNWLLTILLLLYPLVAWVRRRRRCIPQGHCQQCGYSLTGNTTGRCPECGHVVPSLDNSPNLSAATPEPVPVAFEEGS